MITKTHRARCTAPAIAAALVLSSTPLLAQDAGGQPMGQPGDVPAAAPTVAPAPAPQPAPRLQMPVDPAPVPSTTTSNAPVTTTPSTTGAPPVQTTTPTQTPNRVFDSRTVVQQVPPPTESAATPAATAEPAAQPRAAASAAARPAPAPRTVAATPPPEPSIPEQVPEPAPPGDIPPPIPPVPPVIDQSVDEVAATDPISENTSTDTAVWLGLLASGLGVLGLGFLGALALRRRQVRRVDQASVVERPKVAKVPATALVAGTTPETSRRTVPEGVVTTSSITAAPRYDAPVATAPEVRTPTTTAAELPRVEQPVSPIREQRANLAPTGGAVALPRTIPATYEEREALLQRMVAAKPDRANPFHSPRARRRRARLIMQSLGRTFENGKSRIDLSQYPQNWPELQGNRSAAA